MLCDGKIMGRVKQQLIYVLLWLLALFSFVLRYYVFVYL
jgi:hypothetical protein